MTPPIPPGGTGSSPHFGGHDTVPSITPGSGIIDNTYRAAPTLELRTDLRNPIRSLPDRRIATLGDVDQAIVNDFFRSIGLDVVQRLGSYPGFRHPDRPLGLWNPDQKPDYNGVGNAARVLRNLQPYMGWSEETLQANIERSRQGMVYFNQAIETPLGPVPFKMGILDADLFRQGHPYFEIRASLLPFEDTYAFLRDGQEGASISEAEFFDRHRSFEAAWMGRTLATFTQEGFSADELIRQRYRHNFGYYERYRVFDWNKGAKQLEKYRRTSQGDVVPRIIVPGFQRWLLENPGLLEVRDPSQGVINPSQVNAENFSRLEFVWKNSAADRAQIYQDHLAQRGEINSRNWQQTRINIASNKTSRPSFHSIGWVQYGARKFGRLFGIENNSQTRVYTPESSLFLGTEIVTPQRQRLGITENPIEQMIILAGYGPQDERDPAVWDRMIDYAEAEISKGAKPNILIRGNNPSKFTFPVRGIPAIAYRFMDGLRAEGLQNIVVVGPPDVGASLEAFENYFAEEIQDRGKRFIYVDTGLGEGGFAQNLKQGLDRLPNRDGIAILSYGDTPRADLMNVAHHPWRHSLDYIFGANGRDMVLDFMGMNAHYQGDLDGVGYASKEGNTQAVRSQFPMQFWQQIFTNRKSMLSGPLGKVYISLRYLTVRPLEPWSLRTTPGNLLAMASDIIGPRFGALDIPHLIFGDVAPRSIRNVIHRKGSGGSARPPWVAMDVELVEDVFRTQMKWNADFRATHLDPGSLVDVDGIRDYIVAEVLGSAHPHEHQADLDRFAQNGLAAYRNRIPALDNTSNRINDIYSRLREDLLQREAERPTNEKLGMTDETLRRMGFDPEVLPFKDNGEVNEEWLQRVIPESEIQAFQKAFSAYANRGNHAQQLGNEFQARIHNTQAYGEEERVDPKIEKFVLREINAEPERMRGRVLEWSFDRVERAVVEQAQKKFGEHSPEIDGIREYFELSIRGNRDTPLRRVLLGLKAVDVMRRYQSHLSPGEFQNLYPNLVEVLHDAREASPQHQRVRRGPIPHLTQFFNISQGTADQIYIRKVGESPPAYRGRGVLAGRLPHSNGRNPVLRFDGQVPPNGSSAPLSMAEALGLRGEVRRVDSPVFLQRDLDLMSRRMNILPSRIPELVAAASGAHTPADLPRISGEMGVPGVQGGEGRAAIPEIPATPGQRMSFDRLLAWTQSAQGQEYLENNGPRITDRWQNRVIESGPGLAMGIGTLLGAEWVADKIGLDPMRNPHERFMFVVGSSHLVNAGYNSIHEVALNRYLHRTPYSFASTRLVNGGGEAAVQYSFEARQGLMRGMGASLARNYGLQGGLGRMAWNGTKGLVTMPFRASWNMGPGLMSAALVDRVFSEGMLGLDQGSGARRAIHFGSFFAPDAYRIAFGSRGAAFFRSGAMRFASRAFAAGFIADMGFSLVNRVGNTSDGATLNSMVYQQANEMNDRENGSAIGGVLDGAFELVAPQLAAWWDSVEFRGLRPTPNRYQQEARQQLAAYTSQVEQNTRSTLQTQLLEGRGEERFDPNFYRRVDFDFLRDENRLSNGTDSGRRIPAQEFADDLANGPEIRREFNALESHGDRIRYVQNLYSGWNLSNQDVEGVLSRISTHRMRADLGNIQNIPLPQGRTMSALFDESGNLRNGQENPLVREVYGDANMSADQLLQFRQARLLFRVLQLRELGEEGSSTELARLTQVGRQVGLLDSSGNPSNGQVTRLAQTQFEQWRSRRQQDGVWLSTRTDVRRPSVLSSPLLANN